MMTSIHALVVFFSILLMLGTSQKLHLVNHRGGRGDGSVPFLQDDQGRRFVQVQDVVEEFRQSQNCTFQDFVIPNRLLCDRVSRFNGANGTYAQVNVSLGCDSSRQQNTFREAESCECSAVIVDEAGRTKTCTCGVCADGFGDSPLYFDCDDEPLVDDCYSVDCNYQCNGPCQANCEGSRDDCLLCANVTDDTPPTQPDTPLSEVSFFQNNNSCFGDEDRMTCNTFSTMSAPDGSKSYAAVEVSCDTYVLGEWNVREAQNCVCSVQVTGQDGQPRENCECGVCPTGFGQNPVSIICPDSNVIGECVEVDCDAKCNGSCHLGCEEAGDSCPLSCEPPLALGLNSTVDECRATANNTFTCNRETRVVAPDYASFSDLEIEVQCDAMEPGEYNFRNATNCECSLSVTDHLGNARNCECSICQDDFGSNDITIDCQADHVVGECSVIDCNAECNGSCKSKCESSSPRCSLCNVPDPDGPGTNNTNPDDQASPSPTSPPIATGSPTLSPTQQPMTDEQSYTFRKLFVRLEGGKEITSATKVLFEDTTEEFYHARFGTRTSSGRRLEEFTFTSFYTQVEAVAEEFDSRGNAVIYDQQIRFRLEAGSLSEEDARELLLTQLTDPVIKQQYMEMLHNAHPDFLSITEVNPDTITSSDDDSWWSDKMIVLLIAAGVLLCCCCWCIILLVLRRRKDPYETEESDYGKDNYEADAPEAPRYGASERSGSQGQNDPSDHTDFSNENEREKNIEVVPFGEDDATYENEGAFSLNSGDVDESLHSSESSSSHLID